MSRDEPSPYALNYSAQWYLAVIVSLTMVAIGAIQAVGPEELGIPPVTFRWLGILAACLAAASAVLPKITAPPIANYDEVKREEALQELVDAPSVPVPPDLVSSLADELERRREERVAAYRAAQATSAGVDPIETRTRIYGIGGHP